MPVNLTANAIPTIIAGDVNSKPLVQVIDINHIGSNQDRYRFLLSDSVSTQQAMLATQLNDRVKTGAVRNGSVIQMLDYICSLVQNRKIIVILNMETIITDCETIGNPNISKAADSVAPNPNSSGSSIPITNSSYASTNTQNYRPTSNFSVVSQNASDSTQNFCPNSNSGFAAQNVSYNTQNFCPNSNSGFAAQNASHNTQNFRPTVQPSYRPPPNYKNQGAIMKNEAPARIIPIEALNPYQGRWAIKARVTAKGDLRRYNNAKGDGKVFYFDLLDSDGGEIRVTCFNAVVDRFYNIVTVGKVYIISKGSLKPAQKNFNHLKNEWEIFLESASTVDLCDDEDSSIPQQQFSFKPISEIEKADSNSISDIIGIVISVNPSVPIMRKNGMETQRRILNLKDQSLKSVELTLWGEFCNREGQQLQEMIDSGHFPVLAVKAGKVNDFSGKSIGTISSTQLFIDPDSQEAHMLRNWFDQVGKTTSSQSISRDISQGISRNEIRKTVTQIKGEGLGRSDKPDWVTVKGTINFIKTDSFCYTACPLMIGDRQCNKKVSQPYNSGKWECDRCNQEFDECDYRYLLQIQIQDHTGQTWMTAFQESGEHILGCPAKMLYFSKNEEDDDSKFSDVIQSCLFSQYMFRLKIKEETYGDGQKLKITIVKAEKVNYSAESKYLLNLISKR